MASNDPVWLQILTLLIMNCVALTDDLASLCLSFSIYKMRLINLVLHSFIHLLLLFFTQQTLSACLFWAQDQRGAHHHSHTRSEPCS